MKGPWEMLWPTGAEGKQQVQELPGAIPSTRPQDVLWHVLILICSKEMPAGGLGMGQGTHIQARKRP